MNRRDFLRLLAQSAAAGPTTSYFIFGNGVWRPTTWDDIPHVLDWPRIHTSYYDAIMEDDLFSYEKPMIRASEEHIAAFLGWPSPSVPSS